MKCLVTGAAGFIGSHLCEELLKQNAEVTAVDNLLTGSRRNLDSFKHHPQFTFIQRDVSQPLDHISTEVIFHLASPASPPKYMEYPVETLLVNTVGTYQLLELARKCNAKLIYASTSEVYGDPEEHPQREDYWGHVNPVGPRSCYDEAKRAGEAYVATYVRKYGVDGRIVRIFNTYGPRMDIDDGRVVTNFIKQIKTGEPLTIHGNGSQTRSFCYVSDLVAGLVKVIQVDAMKGQVVNLGNDTEITVTDLANRLKQLTHYRGELAFKELPEDDPQRRRPDLTKAKQILHWQPHVTLGEGLRETLRYFGVNT